MYTEGCTPWTGLPVNADDTSAQEMRQQVMDLYFCTEVRDFDTRPMKWFDILAQVRECDASAEVKVFGTWVWATEGFQAAGQSLGEVNLLVCQWTLQYCSVYCLCLGSDSLLQGTQVPYQALGWRDERAQEMGECSCPQAEQHNKKSL